MLKKTPTYIAILIAATTAAFLQSSCGAMQQTAYVEPIASDVSAYDNANLDTALANLHSIETPAGVDPQVFGELKAALKEALISHAIPKATSIPPTGYENQTFVNLHMTDPPYLVWPYINCGDYNQDGVVDVSDITPLAIHFGEYYYDNPINYYIDTSGNHYVDIGDVTAIAMHYGSCVAAYRIEYTQDPYEDGQYTTYDIIEFTSALVEQGVKTFQYDIWMGMPGFWVRVVPVDEDDNRGMPSTSYPWNYSF